VGERRGLTVDWSLNQPALANNTDSEAIAHIVNQVHHGHARYTEIEGMGHDLTVNGKFHAPLVATVTDWMRHRLADR